MSPKFKKIKERVLGRSYDLSFSYVTPAQMRRAMKYKKTRAKKISNVLSFPLSNTSGEILICKEAVAPFTVGYLLIHGLLHLKGLTHGVTMERNEARLLKQFGLRAHE